MSKLGDAIYDVVVRATFTDVPHIRDEIERLILSDRNRRAKARGHAFERKNAKDGNGRRTGPLLGKDDVVYGSQFVSQDKKEARPPSLNVARTYLAQLGDRFPDRIPLFIYSEPGTNRTAVVVLWRKDWFALHGSDGVDAQTTDVIVSDT